MTEKSRTKKQLITDLAELRQLVSESEKFSKYLTAIRHTSQRLQSVQSPELLAQEIISVLEELLDYEFGAVLLIDESTKQLLPFALSNQGFGEDFVEADKSNISSRGIRIGQGITGWVAQNGRSARVGDVLQDERYMSIRSNIRSELCVPLLNKSQIIGVLNIETSLLNAYSEIDQGVLETVASQIAIAIENANLYANLEQSHLELSSAYDNTLKGWSDALDLRDKETKGHSLRVTEMSMKLAHAAGMAEAELAHVRRGALLHDIGKMGVPDAILRKTDSLTDEEWIAIRKHPTFAFELLSPIEYLRPALEIPYCHHEKWDGSGYPRGLKGEQIPLAARLFAIVDVYDALCSDRPYRQGWSKEKVIEHIKSLSGTHFDPKAVELFLDMINEDDS